MGLNVTAIRESFELAKPIADQVVNRFYENLWRDYPESRALFESVDMAKQKAALIKALVFVVENLENTDRLVAYLHGLGSRHAEYGTEVFHYDWVGASLLKTFGEFLGTSWTDDLESQWRTAYGFIAQTMLDGASKVQRPKVKSHLKAVEPNATGGRAATGLPVSIDLPESFRIFIRKKVQDVVRQLVEEEVERSLREELSRLEVASDEEAKKQYGT